MVTQQQQQQSYVETSQRLPSHFKKHELKYLRTNERVSNTNQMHEAKTAELAPSGFDVKSFPRQSRSRGGGIATVYKSTLGSNITFKTNFDFTHTSFEVVQASIT